jgi:hypothetical protein
MDTDLPKPIDFLLTVPAYRPYRFEHNEIWTLAKIIFWTGTYESYCVECKKESTFRVISDELPKELNKYHHDRKKQLAEADIDLPLIDDGLYVRDAVCSRSNAHKQIFVFHVTSDFDLDGSFEIIFQLQKIGQYPSFGDINIAKTKNYSGVLEKHLQKELSRAIGLASHDVGVGAYVYLRRVFEALVEEVHRDRLTAEKWNEEQYLKSRMSEKISILKDSLPKFLTEHPEMYALLSKGIHELSETECLRNFEALRIGIELILDQRLEERERKRKLEQASAAIKSAHQESSK